MRDPYKEKEKRKRRPENGTVIGIVIAVFMGLLAIVMVVARGRQQTIPLDGTVTAIQLTNAEVARLLTGTADAQITFAAQTQQAATMFWVGTDTAPMTFAVETKFSVLATQTARVYETHSVEATDAALMTSTISLLETVIYGGNPDRTSAAATVAAIGNMMATYNAGRFITATLTLTPSFTPSALPTRAPTLTPSPSLSPTITPTSRVAVYPDCPMYMGTHEDYNTALLIERALGSEVFDVPFAPNGIRATAYGEEYHCGDPWLTPTPIFVPQISSFSITLRLTAAEMDNAHFKGMAIRNILWALRDDPLENLDTMTVIFQHENGRRIEWKMTYTATRQAVLDDGLSGEALYNAGKITETP